MRSKFVYVFSSFFLFACSSNQDMDWGDNVMDGGFSKFTEASLEMDDEQGNAQAETTTGVDISGQSVTPERKMIWTGNVEFQVKDLDASTKQINAITKQYDAFVSGMNMYSSNYELSNSISIRVKSERFSDLLSALQTESIHTRSIQVNSNDVTEEFVDINSRLKTKREVRERFITVLNTKTGNVADILEAERSIGKITEEIEAMEGRLRYLSDQVALSTIHVRIFQKVDYVKEPAVYNKTFLDKTKQSLSWGWEAIKAIVLVIVTLWPIWLIGGGVWFYIRRRRNRKKESQNS